MTQILRPYDAIAPIAPITITETIAPIARRCRPDAIDVVDVAHNASDESNGFHRGQAIGSPYDFDG